MGPGETWFIDVRFPHEVANRGDEARVHLVLDLVRDSELDAALSGGEPVGSGRLTRYFLGHSLPGTVRRLLGVGN